MLVRRSVREHAAIVLFLMKWLAVAIPLGMVVGSACAFFLWALDGVTALRIQEPYLLYLLPLAGVAIAWLYQTCGESVAAGNNLIVDEIHQPGGGVPLRMVPLVLVGTIVTHLCGGSAGREGTAVQMGGSLASGLAQRLPGLPRSDVRLILMAGISAGFAGVFGTPVAAMIFALEVLSIGRISYSAILPCLIAAIASDQACLAWGIEHTHYHVASALPASSSLRIAPVDLMLLGKVVLAGIAFGLASRAFAEMVHGLQRLLQQNVPSLLQPVLGGLIVIALVFVVGTHDYLGLGVSSADPATVTIVSCFHAGGAGSWSWFWKLLFTAVTLSSGFKGGEVTPLFFVGAALGNTLAWGCGAPVDLFAALGFVAVFAGATNTPLACTVMAVELFGGEFVVYYATACLLAYLFSGHSGIYMSQRVGTHKFGNPDFPAGTTLRDVHQPDPQASDTDV